MNTNKLDAPRSFTRRIQNLYIFIACIVIRRIRKIIKIKGFEVENFKRMKFRTSYKVAVFSQRPHIICFK